MSVRDFAGRVCGAVCAAWCAGAAAGTLEATPQGIAWTAPAAAAWAGVATGAGRPLWRLTLEPDAVPACPAGEVELTSLDAAEAARAPARDGGTELVWRRLRRGAREWPVTVRVTVRETARGLAWSGAVENGADGWRVTVFTGLCLGGVRADLTERPLYVAEGLGLRVNRLPEKTPGAWAPPEPGKAWPKRGWFARADGEWFYMPGLYPGATASMQYLAFAGGGSGAYFGVHDAAHGAKRLLATRDPAAGTFGVACRHEIVVRPGARWEMPPACWEPFAGGLEAAAAKYRAWFDMVRRPADAPAWARGMSGWLLAILKQQNEEILWPYGALDKLGEIADARGLDVVGLFGWHHGGHDHLYPDYHPDPAMGGEAALREGIRKLRARGKRVIIYANGMLLQRGATAFWDTAGKDLAIVNADGTTVQHSYHKYRDIPKYMFDLACLRSEAWRLRLLNLARQANDLGADGILFDQLAIMSPMRCFATGHGHAPGAFAHETERPAFLRRIADEMRKVNPEFVVATEGITDTARDQIAFFHGCETGVFHATAAEMRARAARTRAADAWPDMFRLTFPDVVTTIRMPTPALDRDMENYTLLHGLRFEIESRYAPDVAYLRDGTVPAEKDYGTVINLPDVKLMNTTGPDAARALLRAGTDFARAHRDLLWDGAFLGETGFTLGTDAAGACAARLYRNGAAAGVAVWNLGDAPVTVRPALALPGRWELRAAAEPGAAAAVDPAAPLEAGRLRLYRFAAAPDRAPEVVNVAERGIVADGVTCQSAALAALIKETPNGGGLFFPKGVYYLSKCVEYSGKTNFAFRGEAGTVIKLHYSPAGEAKESNNGFGGRASRGVSWRGFTVTTDNPPSSAGRVVAKDQKAHTYDVKIDAAFPFTGEEHILGVDTCDADGTPDYIIESWHPVKRVQVPDGAGGTWTKVTALEYEVIGDHLIRITAPKWADLHWLPVGERVYFRYMIYGCTVFSFNDCADVSLADIEIERCASMGAVLGTGTSDFTFERFNMRVPEGSPALIAAGADGIHVLGLSGSLTLRDCHFKGLGDDALNIHAKSGEVKGFDPATGALRCIGRNRKRDETALPKGWARAGDRLIVYDSQTLLTKGKVTLQEYADSGAARIEPGAVAVKNGDFLANARDFPSVHVADCTVENTRARALVLQSHNMLVENCVFRGLSLPGVIISPDFRYWNEVGPTVNTEIRGCLFEKCGINKSRANLGALMVKTSHDANFTDDPAGVHRDIRVIGNTFRNCGNSGIFVQATQGVTVKDNIFENCSSKRYDRNDDANLYDIRLRNCADVVLEGNKTDKPPERLSHITSN